MEAENYTRTFSKDLIDAPGNILIEIVRVRGPQVEHVGRELSAHAQQLLHRTQQLKEDNQIEVSRPALH